MSDTASEPTGHPFSLSSSQLDSTGGDKFRKLSSEISFSTCWDSLSRTLFVNDKFVWQKGDWNTVCRTRSVQNKNNLFCVRIVATKSHTDHLWADPASGSDRLNHFASRP